ncbi:hypothetical protein Hanom_Chr06g00502121 [Helianthus anomalus]
MLEFCWFCDSRITWICLKIVWETYRNKARIEPSSSSSLVELRFSSARLHPYSSTSFFNE